MSRKLKTLATAFYGLAVVANGSLSLLSKEGGKAGLWFGLVMGALALGAALLLWIGFRIAGTAIAWVVVAFVGGWFVYSTFIKRGFVYGELRVYSIIALTLLEALLLCWPTKHKSTTPGES